MSSAPAPAAGVDLAMESASPLSKPLPAPAPAAQDASGAYVSPSNCRGRGAAAEAEPEPHYVTALRELQETRRDQPPPGCCSTLASHFAALMRKNALQKIRAPITCLLEVLLPLLFVAGLIAVWAITDSDTVEDTQFVNTSAGALPAPTDYSTVLKTFACSNPAAGGSPAFSGLRPCSADEIAADTTECGLNGDGPRTGGGGAGAPVMDQLCFANASQAKLLPFAFIKGRGPRFIPALDELVLMQTLAASSFPERMRQNYNSPAMALVNGGRVQVVPDNAVARQFVSWLNSTAPVTDVLFDKYYASWQEASDAAKLNANFGTWVVVELSSMTTTDFDVTLHFNRSGLPWTHRLKDRFQTTGVGRHSMRHFLTSGFATWQSLVTEFYSTEVLGLAVPAANKLSKGDASTPGAATAGHDLAASVAYQWPYVVPMPFKGFATSGFLAMVGNMIPLALVFGYLFSVSQLTKRIVEEKETRMREAMMIMGLGTSSFYTSWLLTYFAMHFVGALLMTVAVKATMLPLSDPLIIFFLFYFFSCSTVTLSALFASFFSRARVSALVAPMLFFLCAMPSFALSNTAPPQVLAALSILSPSAFSLGASVVFGYERSGGATSENFARSEEGVSLLFVFVMLIFDCVLYFLITLYLDAVLPNDWGTRKHPCFCFTAMFRACARLCGGGRGGGAGDGGLDAGLEGLDSDGRDPEGHFETVRRDAKPTVLIRGLRKEFDTPGGRMVAVRDLAYDLYEGDVTVVLGHNGAGKTTTINMMTGMLGATHGDCSIYGRSITSELGAVRQEVGMCPQHNILWDDLTCREHLHFFATVKGFAGDDRLKAIDAMLDAVDLREKADVRSAGLSGGQKRKLSVGIAFVGGSRMVFLDEPTAGMDVAARRFTWDLIKQMSPGRTIVLTTHFMDEADLLGNTVAIMSKGRLKCAGSSHFLKSRLGVGYNLTMAMDHETTAADQRAPHNATAEELTTAIDAVFALVKSHVADAELLSRSGGELTIRLPMASVPAFPALLRELEDKSKPVARSIRGFGVSVTTLEEIFLQIGHQEEMEASQESDSGDSGAIDIKSGDVEMSDAAVAVPPAGHPNPHEAAEALAKRWGEQAGREKERGHAVPYGSQFAALVVKRFHNAKRDRRAQVMQILLPIIGILLAMATTLLKFPAAKKLILSPDMLDSTHNRRTPPEAKGSDVVYSHCPTDLADSLHGSVMETVIADDKVAAPGALSNYLLDTFKQHRGDRPRPAAWMCDDGSGRNLGALFINDTATRHSLGLALAEYQGAQIRRAVKAGGAGAAPSLQLASEPLPLSDRESGFVESLGQLLVAIFILIPFTFIPSTFVAWVVKERECKAKHLQLVNGMNYIVYWVSNFVFDVLSFVVTTLLAVALFLAFQRKEYVGTAGAFFATFLLFMLYGVAAVAGSYLVSFLFDSHASAQNIVMLVNFISGFLLVLVAYFLALIPSTKDVGDVVPYIFRVIPAFCLGNGLLNLASLDLASAVSGKELTPWDMDVTGWNLIYLVVEVPLFFALVLLIDHPSLLKRAQAFASHEREPEAIVDEDADVVAERREVEGGKRANDVVLVKNLRKLYKTSKGTKLAVKNLSFGVKKGEVFGFLGTNGAGKTTTISVLCGEFAPTAGHAEVAGLDVVTRGGESRRLLGYCPQFDAILELLTVDEHLELYAGLRGITGDTRRSVVDGLVSACGLEEHRRKESRSLSGGNKRKLSVAMALIGGPQVLFLDEPSAGMDPMARRGLWDVLQAVANHCSIVLTTHHLEEVEALSTRVAIMDQGEMKCVGSLQHLKSKFGSGFEMTLRVQDALDEEALARAQEFVLDRLPGAAVQESRGGKVTFSLPAAGAAPATGGAADLDTLGGTPEAAGPAGGTRLSEVFALIEAHKQELRVEDYSVSQTSLESVFLNVAREGMDAQEE